MTANQVNLIYFSPTNTTAKILNSIAEGLRIDDIRSVNLTLVADRMSNVIEITEGLTILGAPVYGGRIPLTAVDAFKKLKSNGQPVVLVVLYGNREFEDALLELKDISIQAGFKPIAGGAFIGEHSYATETYPIAVGRPDANDLDQARAFGAKILEKMNGIQAMSDIAELSIPGNSPYKDRRPRSPIAPKTIEDNCSLCNTCAEVCPTDAIVVSDKVVTDPELCIACCACVKSCPDDARIMDDPGIEKIAQWLTESYSARKEPELFI